MHPAYSVIFFTVSSGLGFGLVMLIGVFAVLGRLPDDPIIGGVLIALALGFAAVGLVSSMLHLGHPERAWRALGQWRSSWLSREGVAALATYPPALMLGWGWVAGGGTHGLYAWAGVAAAVLALATVVATGMIYQSLPTIHAWAHRLVTPNYLLMALAGASLWLAAVARVFGITDPALTHLPVGLVLAAWIGKAAYWRQIDARHGRSTPQSATGLGRPGERVRLLDAPHTQENFVMREMGYRVARRHAQRLRNAAQVIGFFLPLALTEAAMLAPGGAGPLGAGFAVVAALLGIAGIAVERWLFFAEARHVVTLYYGAGHA